MARQDKDDVAIVEPAVLQGTELIGDASVKLASVVATAEGQRLPPIGSGSASEATRSVAVGMSPNVDCRPDAVGSAAPRAEIVNGAHVAPDTLVAAGNCLVSAESVAMDKEEVDRDETKKIACNDSLPSELPVSGRLPALAQRAPMCGPTPTRPSGQQLPCVTKLRLEKLAAISHRASSILSVDFAPCPGRRRLATSSQDGTVKVWAWENETDNKPVECTCLATLEEHLAPVNCVRWSPDQAFIASGDAGAGLVVWAPGPGRFVMAPKASAGPEPWHRHFLLRGHEGEICDVAWHPEMKTRFALASCSHDESIRVWNIRRGEMTVSLRSTTGGLVKGIAFDPLGQFLAAMSEAPGTSNQPRVMLWECPDDDGEAAGEGWGCVQLCGDPWSHPSPLGTAVYVRRPTWDPLGQSLCFPYGERVRCQRSTPRYFGALFVRGAWENPKTYRGHMQRVSLVRFCPVPFGPVGDAEHSSVVLAMASQDGVMSIWSSECFSPVLVLTDLVDENMIITDVSWAPDGGSIAFASNDGAVGLVVLGWPSTGPRWSSLDVRRWRCQRLLESAQMTSNLPATCSQLLKRKVEELDEMSVDRLEGSFPAVSQRRVGARIDSSVGSQRGAHDVVDGNIGTADVSCASSLPRQNGKLHLSFSEWQTAVNHTAPAATAETQVSGSWDPPRSPAVLPLRPLRGGSWSVVDEVGRLELCIARVVDPDAFEETLTRISLIEHFPCLGTVAGNFGGTSCQSAHDRPRWQLILDGAVRCACMCPDVVVLAMESAHGASSKLLIVDTRFGQQVLPRLLLDSRVADLFLSPGGGVALVLDEAGRIYVWAICGATHPHLLTETILPVPGDRVVKVGLAPGSSAPLLRLADGGAIAFHMGLQAWLALDAWRYAGSQLQCHAALPCPRDGALSELLWAWRHPRLSSDWADACVGTRGGSDGGTSGDDAPPALSGYDVHLETSAQLCHELAIACLLGTGSEARVVIRDLINYCAEAGDSNHVNELMEALGTVPSTTHGGGGPVALLAGLLERLGLDRAKLRGEVSPKLAALGFEGVGADAPQVQ